MKICNKCFESKPLDQFYKNGKFGLKPKCKICYNLYSQKNAHRYLYNEDDKIDLKKWTRYFEPGIEEDIKRWVAEAIVEMDKWLEEKRRCR